VHGHGGRITLTSEEGAGTTFRISIPVRQTQAKPVEHEEVAS
jgi:signal transduction histidine kinase